MSLIRPVRGTSDLLPEDCRHMRHLIDGARALASLYGYEEISTPIFEQACLFSRTLGAGTDVVTKEMYSFSDHGGKALSLRPEGTAALARAVISNQMQPPCKLFYQGPMFRYERPQKGRMRQFHQFGVEFFGVSDPLADVETILLGQHILEDLGLGDRLTLRVNSLGDTESRLAYRTKLVAYLTSRETELSQESRRRLKINPLRILDSKEAQDQAVVKQAPLLQESFNRSSERFFAELCQGLTDFGVSFVQDPFLVRGLDYYCHTAFEFVSDDLGAQNAVLAGGRYDGLIESLGGGKIPGIGWAAGIERLRVLSAISSPEQTSIAVIPVGNHHQMTAMRVAHDLRVAGLRADIGFQGNLKKRLTRAHKIGSHSAIFIGDDEISCNAATLRDLTTGEQRKVAFERLPEYFKKRDEGLPFD